MPRHVIVWDLETIPDIAGYAAANALTGKSDGEIREALGNKFPKHIYHAIVCIGALVAHKENDHWTVDAISAPHVGDRTEKQLISAFVDKIVNELSKIMGLPGKPDGIDGTEVERYFLDGKIKEIAEYCENDVVNTYRVWLRYELFRGKLNDAGFQASEANLREFITARNSRTAGRLTCPAT
jgi:hypothetical protein